MSDDPIATIYTTDRTDGSTIYQVNMNLMAVITTYGALVVAAISSTFLVNPWVRAFIGVPLWGLLCYQWNLLALIKVRVNSISILERKLLDRVPSDILNSQEKNQIGSDAGDWMTRLGRQPKGLKAANVAAFAGFTIAAAVVAFVSLGSALHDNPWAFAIGLMVHLAFAGFLAAAVYSVWGMDLEDVAKRSEYVAEPDTPEDTSPASVSKT
jgi:hypothetical protein